MKDVVVTFEVGLGVHWHGHVDPEGEPMFFDETSPGNCPACTVVGRSSAVVTAVNCEKGILTVDVEKP